MSYRWDHNDQKIWSNSEVLNELEMTLMKRAIELKNKIEAQMTAGKIEQTKKDVVELDKSLTTVTEKVKNLADDELPADSIEISDEEYAKAKEDLIFELREKVSEAIEKNDKKLAYRIERTIDELLFEE